VFDATFSWQGFREQLMNIRQRAVPVAVTMLLFALCFPSWTDAASAGASFMLTKQSLDNLRKEGLLTKF
jgi:hypothetical protein